MPADWCPPVVHVSEALQGTEGQRTIALGVVAGVRIFHCHEVRLATEPTFPGALTGGWPDAALPGGSKPHSLLPGHALERGGGNNRVSPRGTY